MPFSIWMSMPRLSSGRVAAIDVNGLAGDERGSRRRQERQDADYVLDLAQPADGRAIEHFLIKLRLSAYQLAVEVRHDDRRTYRVDRDAMRSEFESERGAEIREPGLGRAISRARRHPAHGKDRAHVDDAAAPLSDHRLCERARAKKCAS